MKKTSCTVIWGVDTSQSIFSITTCTIFLKNGCMSTLPYDQGRVTGSRFTLLPEIRTKTPSKIYETRVFKALHNRKKNVNDF